MSYLYNKMGNNQGLSNEEYKVTSDEEMTEEEDYISEQEDTEEMLKEAEKKKEVVNVMIDIDGTVSDDIPNEESHLFATAGILDKSVESVNDLYEKGYYITFFTARRETDREVTEKWLKESGFKYHDLLMNKPRGGNYIWIDNHNVLGIKYKDNWEEINKCFPKC